MPWALLHALKKYSYKCIKYKSRNYDNYTIYIRGFYPFTDPLSYLTKYKKYQKSI